MSVKHTSDFQTSIVKYISTPTNNQQFGIQGFHLDSSMQTNLTSGHKNRNEMAAQHTNSVTMLSLKILSHE